ncbi:hypothetical protein CL619_00615 [archaeon]|nr:hypothetical protein [archaeon]|tara:strand:- start:1407 stop:1814 length:408 start_codon:yes stop_codon:yes gene_type:complete
MGFMDKLMFWKKDDFDFDSISNDPMKPTGSTSTSPDPFASSTNPTTPDPFASQNPTSPTGAPNYNPSAHAPEAFAQAKSSAAGPSSREVELMNSKLDTIKALLASLDQRVGVIEQIARAEQAKHQKEQQPKNHLW